MEVNEVMNVQEVAEYLRCSESQVKKLAKEGKLPLRKLGARWIGHRETLEKWLRVGEKEQ